MTTPKPVEITDEMVKRLCAYAKSYGGGLVILESFAADLLRAAFRHDANMMNKLHDVAHAIRPDALFGCRERMANAAIDAMVAVPCPDDPQALTPPSEPEIEVSEGMIKEGSLAVANRHVGFGGFASVFTAEELADAYRAMESQRRKEAMEEGLSAENLTKESLRILREKCTQFCLPGMVLIKDRRQWIMSASHNLETGQITTPPRRRKTDR